ncbi:MAG: electron transfer flavoprotein-ubiquinone oxidoreductase, partial [Proteobacteria bacterium]|nr:electron transfer flavoprotein-ubiquinone oxidoreductase [Pseudomonadota bacterium]
VMHTLGWPLDDKTGGGSFVYHYGDNLAAVGFVVHLDYANPHLSPFGEFQRFKTHPIIRPMLEGGRRIAYGARAITEGGLQAVPKLGFPGGALLGCVAGLVNVARIKGTHNAIKSGMLAAEAAFEALSEGRAHDALDSYDVAYRASSIHADLYRVRNVKPLWSRYGTILGVALGGLDMWAHRFFGRGVFGTLSSESPDHARLKRVSASRPISYPAPDARVSFDLMSSVYLSGVHHEEDQPVHLKFTDETLPIAQNLPNYGEPARLYCPAGVFEVIKGPQVDPRFVVNAANCVHCKVCEIKDPAQNIVWTPPEGGNGPNYANM